MERHPSFRKYLSQEDFQKDRQIVCRQTRARRQFHLRIRKGQARAYWLVHKQHRRLPGPGRRIPSCSLPSTIHSTRPYLQQHSLSTVSCYPSLSLSLSLSLSSPLPQPVSLPTMLLTPGPPVNHSVRGSFSGSSRLSKYPGSLISLASAFQYRCFHVIARILPLQPGTHRKTGVCHESPPIPYTVGTQHHTDHRPVL